MVKVLCGSPGAWYVCCLPCRYSCLLVQTMHCSIITGSSCQPAAAYTIVKHFRTSCKQHYSKYRPFLLVSVIGNDEQADRDVTTHNFTSWLPVFSCQPLSIFSFYLNDLLFQSCFRLGRFYNDFLQARYPFCRPINSVETLKGMLHVFPHSLSDLMNSRNGYCTMMTSA